MIMGIDWPKTHARRARLALLEARGAADPAMRMTLLKRARLEAIEARDALASERSKAEFLREHPEARRVLGLDEKATAPRGAA
jgi:hypothetical protein